MQGGLFWLIAVVVVTATPILFSLAIPSSWPTWSRILLPIATTALVAGALLLGLWLFNAPVALWKQRNEARAAWIEVTDRALDIEVQASTTTQPMGWPWEAAQLIQWQPYRLTVTVVNHGIGRTLEAVVVPPVEGTDWPDYGDFFLQWDLTREPTKRFPSGRSWKLHVAAAKDNTIQFLGPPANAYHYRGWTSERFAGVFEIRDADSDRVAAFNFLVTFDEGGKPLLEVTPYTNSMFG